MADASITVGHNKWCIFNPAFLLSPFSPFSFLQPKPETLIYYSLLSPDDLFFVFIAPSMAKARTVSTYSS